MRIDTVKKIVGWIILMAPFVAIAVGVGMSHNGPSILLGLLGAAILLGCVFTGAYLIDSGSEPGDP